MTEFKLKILTPEGVVYDGMAESVIVRTTVGDKGILAKHEPYVAALTIGQAKIRTFFENASVLLKLFSKNYSMKRELNNCQPSVKPTFQSLDGEL